MRTSLKSVWKLLPGQLDFDIDMNEVITSRRTEIFGIECPKCRFDTEITSVHGYLLGLASKKLPKDIN